MMRDKALDMRDVGEMADPDGVSGAHDGGSSGHEGTE
jgi:hypothetical protein